MCSYDDQETVDVVVVSAVTNDVGGSVDVDVNDDDWAESPLLANESKMISFALSPKNGRSPQVSKLVYKNFVDGSKASHTNLIKEEVMVSSPAEDEDFVSFVDFDSE